MSLAQAVSLINDGDSVGIGGNVLHRAPMALVREIARQQKKSLKLIKTAGAMDKDLLCLAECVSSVDAGFVSYGNGFSFSGHLIDANDYFTKVQDPFSGEMVTVVKALKPNVAIIHVQEADANGNARIIGPKFEDVLLSRAADKVIISAETIVPETKFAYASEKADIPHFMVEAVVRATKGAAPSSCPSKYDIDRKSLDEFKAIKDKDDLYSYLERYKAIDYKG